ncbi:hypothetical protein [Streptomyces thioluteus]|uniref:hypothetical protein n=1 Tax=Streptomyces thioluteus TaxID=66431 RepID=UPI0031E6A00C
MTDSTQRAVSMEQSPDRVKSQQFLDRNAIVIFGKASPGSWWTARTVSGRAMFTG